MSDAKVLGRFVWHELLTHDVAAGIAYYSKVVGWTSQAWDSDTAYTLFVGPNGPVAGCMTMPEDAKAMGTPPNWCSYIGVPDVDSTAVDAEVLGATILHAPEDIPGAGRFAIVQDPQGAVFGIYTPPPGMPSPSDAPPAIGEFSWHELITTDVDAAWEFYSQLFGWSKTSAMDMGDMGVYQMYGLGGVPMGGIYRKPANMPAPPHWLPYARVPDTRKATALAEKLGATILHGNQEVPGGDIITVAMDPQGTAFALHSSAPAVKATKPAAAKPAAKAKKAAKKAQKKKPTKKAAKKTAKPAKKKPAKKAARKPAKKGAKKAAKRRAPKKAARKSPKKAARKSAKKAARRGPRKAARKASRKRAPAKRPAKRKKK